MNPEYDFMTLDRDFATMVDNFMVPQDVGIRPERPVGTLERLEIPFISNIFKSLKVAPPALASVVIELYDFSYAALTDIAKAIEEIRGEVVAGKQLKAFSIPTESGGLTYVACRDLSRGTQAAAEAIGQKHKYDQKRDRWYVIVDSIATNAPVDALLPLAAKWKEDAELAENSRQVDEIFKTRAHPRAAPSRRG
jgi:hypothetical protein